MYDKKIQNYVEDELEDAKLLRYKDYNYRFTLHTGSDFHMDVEGLVEDKQYCNLQIQGKSRPSSHALKGKSRGNDTTDTVACVFVSVEWNREASEIKAAFAESASLPSASQLFSIVYLDANGITRVKEPEVPKTKKKQAQKKEHDESKAAAEAKKRANRN